MANSLTFRDGLERILVPDGATIASLKRQITESLDVPQKDITLSTDKDLVGTLPCCLKQYLSLLMHQMPPATHQS